MCAPERTVRSFIVRPSFENTVVSVDKSEDEGFWLLGALWLAVFCLFCIASLLPSGTIHEGPPSKKTPSLAASARISAQETVALQAASTLVLMVSITSKPLAEFLLGATFFSPTNVAVSSNKIDPSHPFTKQSWKNKRSIEAPIRASVLIALVIVLRTMVWRLGQVLR